MQYAVIPFIASMQMGQTASVAAQQLADLINYNAGQGWRYCRMENVEIIVHNPGDKGCFGLGATPPTQSITRYDMVVFVKD